MGEIWTGCNMRLHMNCIQIAVLLLLIASIADTLPVGLNGGRNADESIIGSLTASNQPVRSTLVNVKQRTLLKLIERQLTQNTPIIDFNRDSGQPTYLSSLKHPSTSDSTLQNRIGKFLQDYRRRLEWHKHSRVLKREASADQEFYEPSHPSHHSRRSESLPPSRFSGRRHIRHSRRRFMEKVGERSGWGGGYG